MRVSGRNLPKFFVCSEPGRYSTNSTLWPSGSFSIMLRLPSRPVCKRIRHLHALASQEVAQLLDIGSLEGDVREAVFRGALQLGKDFDVLVIVDLEIRQH